MNDQCKKIRLAFLTPKIHLGGDTTIGVQKKIEAQGLALKKIGFQVKILGFPPYRYPSSGLNPQTLVREYFRANAWYTENFNKALAELKDFAPDTIYIRYGFSEKRFIHFLRKLRKTFGPEIPVYLEIPTYPYDRELRSSGNIGLIGLYYIDRYYRRKLSKYIDRIVTFSQYSTLFSIPTIKTGNGVDTGSIKPPASSKRKSTPDSYHFIGVANLAFWVGYDRMIKGLKIYNSYDPEKPVYFDIVGDGPEMKALQEMVKTAGLQDTVSFHGVKFGESLDRLFSGPMLAIGNLASHRRGLKINPDLKNREYCARGLPLVTSVIDPGFPENFPYLLRISADEKPVEIASLVEFMDHLKRNYPDSRDTIRAFAERHFDWSVMLLPVAEEIKIALAEKQLTLRKGQRTR